jgi:hypothetical protein
MSVAACPRDMFTPTLTALTKEAVWCGYRESHRTNSLPFQTATWFILYHQEVLASPASEMFSF